MYADVKMEPRPKRRVRIPQVPIQTARPRRPAKREPDQSIGPDRTERRRYHMNRNRVYRAIRRASYRVPRIPLLYRICRRYVDDYDGVTNCDLHINGELRFLASVCRDLETKVAFDVGANEGDWSEAALAVDPDLSVHCFEPGQSAFQHLQARGFPGRVVPQNMALGAGRGTARLHVYGRDTSRQASLHPRFTTTASDSYEIQTDTVSEYCREHGISRIGYLKADVEGNELAVLQGAEDMLADGRITAGQFEYGENYIDARILFKDVYDLLTRHGYRIYRITPRGPVHIGRYTYRLEDFRNANYGFLAPHFAPGTSDFKMAG